MTFLDIRFIDLLDILLVAFLLYQIYILLKGTVAMNIFMGIFITYLIWLLVKALDMQLLSSILGQVMGVGVIALIIVFQQEVRRFFLLLSSKYFSNISFSIENMFAFIIKPQPSVKIKSIIDACHSMSKTKTGALIVIAKSSELDIFTEEGLILNADTSKGLLESIFYKNSPLHDGAVVMYTDKIHAAKCVLPLSKNKKMPENMGLRHRSALGVSEKTDASVVIVSEETGNISYAKNGKILSNIGSKKLEEFLRNEFEEEPLNLKIEIKKLINKFLIKEN